MPPAQPHPAPSPADEHRAAAPASVRCAVVTVSDTRTHSDDRGGALIVELLGRHGHPVTMRQLVPDDPERIAAALDEAARRDDVDAALLTGGTGIAARDNTVEVVAARLTRELPGYGELLRMLSFQEVGAAAMLSRATGGVIGRTVVLTMPGSTAAVRLAMERLIVPELAHLVREANR